MAKIKKNRDDFGRPTISKLKSMAGDVCSSPSCRRITGGSKKLNDKPFSIGVAAHICAAARNGPRYDASMSSELRSSYENGIWLCANCSIAIDRDWQAYPIKLLQSWKSQAEAWSASSVGKRLIPIFEHEKEVRKAVGRNIIDYANGDLGSAEILEGVLDGYVDSLNEMDDRLDVKVSLSSDGVLEHHIYAKPGLDAKIGISFKDKAADGSVDGKLKVLFEQGRAVEFEPGTFEITGTKVIGDVSAGTLHIKPEVRKMLLSIELEIEGISYEFAEFECESSYGSRAGSVRGFAYSGLLEINLTWEHGGGSPNINITFDNSPWLGGDVERLKYFGKFKKLVERTANCVEIIFRVEATNEKGTYTIGSGLFDSQNDLLDFIALHVDMIDAAKVIGKQLAYPLRVLSFESTYADQKKIRKYAAALSGSMIDRVEEGHEFCKFRVTDNALLVAAEGEAGDKLVFKVRMGEYDFINVLGNSIKAPPLELYLNGCVVNRFSYLDGEVDRRDGAVVCAGRDAKCITSISEEYPWIIESFGS